MGCGEAMLAQRLHGTVAEVQSYDLQALNDRVIVCDMRKVRVHVLPKTVLTSYNSQVPVASETADYCVFCLSLMGTNTCEFVREANRILKTGTGTLIIAEIRSRISSMRRFLNALQLLGFDAQRAVGSSQTDREMVSECVCSKHWAVTCSC
jgi:hypothetical protein